MPAGMLAAATLDQSNLQSNTGLCDSFTFYAQTFTAGKTGPLVGVDLYIAAGNMSAYDAGLTIRQVDGSTGWPTGTDQDISHVHVAANFSGLEHFSLPGDVIVTAGTQYAIEYARWNGGLVADPYGSICLMFGGSYAGGQGLNWSMGSPPTWSNVGEWAFQTYVDTQDANPTPTPTPTPPPGPTVPGKPTDLIATGGNGAASVSWMGPVDNGGSSITGYTVTSAPDGKTCTTTGALSCTVSGLTNGQSYTFTVSAANGVGTSAASDPSNSVTPAAGPPGATYRSVGPVRILDSRSSLGDSTFVSRTKQTLDVVGSSAGIPAGAVAVTGNLTIVGQSALGYVSLAPSLTSGTQPGTSTINFPVGDIRANGVTVPLSASGTIDIMYWASSTTDTVNVLFDVTGYFSDDTTGATYHSVGPVRILDSRSSLGDSTFVSRTKQTLNVTGSLAGVPAGAVAVTGNLTVVGQTALGYVSLAPSLTSGTQPGTSTINFPVGDIRANGVTVPLSALGTIDIMYWASSTTDTVNVLFDVTGYFSDDTTGATYHSVGPVRILDSRSSLGDSTFVSRTRQTLNVTGSSAGVPAGAVAVTGNVTVVGQSALGYVSLAPSLTTGTQPDTSTINFPVGDIRANGVTVPLSALGTIDVMYWASSTTDTVNVLFDVTGYFSAS